MTPVEIPTVQTATDTGEESQWVADPATKPSVEIDTVETTRPAEPGADPRYLLERIDLRGNRKTLGQVIL